MTAAESFENKHFSVGHSSMRHCFFHNERPVSRFDTLGTSYLSITSISDRLGLPSSASDHESPSGHRLKWKIPRDNFKETRTYQIDRREEQTYYTHNVSLDVRKLLVILHHDIIRY